MSYAIRNDKQGWRAVNGPDDVGADEYYSEAPIEVVPLPLTYKHALDALNTTYQVDVAKLNNAFALTLLADGPSEATKMAAIRSQYEARKVQHVVNVAALKIEYGV